MDRARARALLGLGPEPSQDQVRAAYRSRIALAHPDRAGGSTEQAAALNRAYATLRRPAETAAALPEERDGATGPTEVLDGDTIHLPLPADEAFPLLVEAAHRIGDVTYVDASCAIFEALVAVDGEGTCSLVVTLQGRADGTDAFCTLEAIEHVASPPVRPVVEALSRAL